MNGEAEGELLSGAGRSARERCAGDAEHGQAERPVHGVCPATEASRTTFGVSPEHGDGKRKTECRWCAACGQLGGTQSLGQDGLGSEANFGLTHPRVARISCLKWPTCMVGATLTRSSRAGSRAGSTSRAQEVHPGNQEGGEDWPGEVHGSAGGKAKLQQGEFPELGRPRQGGRIDSLSWRSRDITYLRRYHQCGDQQMEVHRTRTKTGMQFVRPSVRASKELVGELVFQAHGDEQGCQHLQPR